MKKGEDVIFLLRFLSTALSPPAAIYVFPTVSIFYIPKARVSSSNSLNRLSNNETIFTPS